MQKTLSVSSAITMIAEFRKHLVPLLTISVDTANALLAFPQTEPYREMLSKKFEEHQKNVKIDIRKLDLFVKKIRSMKDPISKTNTKKVMKFMQNSLEGMKNWTATFNKFLDTDVNNIVEIIEKAEKNAEEGFMEDSE